MLSTDKHCELLTEHIRDQNRRIGDAFKTFVQLFSAIVGGAIWLRIQPNWRFQCDFAHASDGLVLLVAVVFAVIVIDNARAWTGYRKRLTEIAGRNRTGGLIVPPPNIRKSLWAEVAMVLTMAAAVGLFWTFNPLANSG